MVSNPNSESRLAHTKQDKVLIVNFIDCLEKCDFLQMTSNIGILYTVGKYFFHEYEFEIIMSK